MMAIPGFLGLPSDWQGGDIQGVDLAAFSCQSLTAWASQFNASIKQPTCLMGYSLGGRLVLHAMCQNPSLWQAAVIVSAHPGLGDEALKQERLQRDFEWARLFEQEPWESLMQKWNAQAIFKQDAFQFQRQEKDYSRAYLAAMLRQFSLGKQEDLREKIQQLPMPILWVVGAKDLVYSELAKSLTFRHPLSACVVIPDAGHRAPWSQPVLFRQAVENFQLALRSTLP